MQLCVVYSSSRMRRIKTEVQDIILKQWTMTERKLAAEMLKYLRMTTTNDASVSPAGVRFLIDVARNEAGITRPVATAEVFDQSFIDRAWKEMGIGN